MTSKSDFKELLLIGVLFVLFWGCDEKVINTNEESEKTILPAKSSEAWDNLFILNRGWFGGDGIFGIPLDGKEYVKASDSTKTLFTFSDTMIGYHNGKVLSAGNFQMINNSLAILDGANPDPNRIKFYWKELNNGKAASLFVPQTASSMPGDYYWLGDGFVNVEGDGKLYIFAYPIRNKSNPKPNEFNFEQIGVNLLSISLDTPPPYFNHDQIETPFFDANNQTTFGSAIFVNTAPAGAPNPDGFIYIYAVSNQAGVKGLLVARVTSQNFPDFSQWRFWDGKAWVPNMEQASFIAKDVSNEMSVSPLADGRILLTYQRYTLGPEVAIQIGSSPVGPFDEQQIVYEAPEFNIEKKYFTYNAKAFPHLSTASKILASYNVNSFDFFNDILKDPNLYRPRFIEIPID
jgi:hypothetical protein